MSSSMTMDDAADEFFHGEDAAEGDRIICPEQALFQAVISRAWHDAFIAADGFLRQSEGSSGDTDFDPELVRGDARRWLTLDLDPWREDRETICDYAGISPDFIRRMAKKQLAEVKKAESEKRTAKVINLEQSLALLIDNEHGLDDDKIDEALADLAALESAA